MTQEMETVLREMLASARGALIRGEAQDAERTAKALSALVRAERDVAGLMQELRPAEENDEAYCAELRRRLALYVEADLADAPAEVLERIALAGSAA